MGGAVATADQDERRPSLPDRIWALLRTTGPSFAASIADELDAGSAAVTGALSSLRRRQLVDGGTRVGNRVIYAALDAAAPEPPLSGPMRDYLDAFDRWLAEPSTRHYRERRRALADLQATARPQRAAA